MNINNIIEDIQCCYWPSFEGGLKEKNSSMEMIKSLLDNIHACYYKSENKIKSPRAKHKISHEPSNYLDKSVSSVHVYDSIAVIYKNIKPELVPSSLEGNFCQEVHLSKEICEAHGVNFFLNDIDDTYSESKNNTYKKYISNPNFNQDLIGKQNKADYLQIRYFLSQKKS